MNNNNFALQAQSADTVSGMRNLFSLSGQSRRAAALRGVRERHAGAGHAVGQ